MGKLILEPNVTFTADVENADIVFNSATMEYLYGEDWLTKQFISAVADGVLEIGCFGSFHVIKLRWDKGDVNTVAVTDEKQPRDFSQFAWIDNSEFKEDARTTFFISKEGVSSNPYFQLCAATADVMFKLYRVRESDYAVYLGFEPKPMPRSKAIRGDTGEMYSYYRPLPKFHDHEYTQPIKEVRSHCYPWYVTPGKRK